MPAGLTEGGGRSSLGARISGSGERDDGPEINGGGEVGSAAVQGGESHPEAISTTPRRPGPLVREEMYDVHRQLGLKAYDRLCGEYASSTARYAVLGLPDDERAIADARSWARVASVRGARVEERCDESRGPGMRRQEGRGMIFDTHAPTPLVFGSKRASPYHVPNVGALGDAVRSCRGPRWVGHEAVSVGAKGVCAKHGGRLTGTDGDLGERDGLHGGAKS